MKTIYQPRIGNPGGRYSVDVEKDLDGDLHMEIRGRATGSLETCQEAFAFLDRTRAQELVSAIVSVMGFTAPCAGCPVTASPAPLPKRAAPKGPQSYKGNGNHKWELVTEDAKGAGHTYRLRVAGGFLYRTVTTDPAYVGKIVAQSTTFVPMPDVVGYPI